jgi:two-component system response regulator YesN
MYKVLLVDDEMLARVGIKVIIPWEQYGFEIVAEAENGQKALEIYDQIKPDVILTDIKMPVMNGIDLIKTLKQLDKNFKFFVLSAYEEVSYLKEMLRLGAEDYFQKLEMNPQNLIQILEKIKLKLDLDRKETIAREDNERQIHSSRMAMKEKFLKDLVLGWIHDEREIDEKLKFLNLKLSQKQFMCFVLHIDNPEIYYKYKGNDIHLLNFSVVNIVEEILNHFQWAYIFSMTPKEFVIVYSPPVVISKLQQQEKMMQLTDRVKVTLKKFLGTSVTIGVSNIHAQYKSLSQCYREAQQAIQSNFHSEHGSTILYQIPKEDSGEGEANDGMSFELLDELRHFNEALIEYDVEKARRLFDNMDRLAQGSNLSKDMAKGICTALIVMLKPTFAELWNNDPYEQIEHFSLKIEYIKWIRDLKESLMPLLSEDLDDTRLIRKAKKYIREHYQGVVSLEIVAEQLTITANYLSLLFKKQTGQNFIEYVTQVRMDKAKELLKTNRLKNSEIAQMVGYDNEFYFSRVFKKSTGITPQDYKNSGGRSS